MNFTSNDPHFKLAADFVNSTSEHIFLTGKAGTGKTTFLKYISQNSHKQVLVTAPTGVAAINAGGVTLHSLFQLPLEPYIPNTRVKDTYRFGKNKLAILQQAELLIIDEVSMLRADTLDAVDATLKFTRRSRKPFGGIQMLYIGDLFQLPPVVKNSEWELLKNYYKSPFFFHAKSVEENPPVYLELKTVYRQQEQTFVNLLNKVRNDILTNEDYKLLNSRYRPNFKDDDNAGYVTLCTHNYQADQINAVELQKLKTPACDFEGEIKGEFPDSILPTEKNLILKEGARVMFIRNDVEEPRRYYNGKTATVTKIDDDEIYVKPDGFESDFVVAKETWRNLKYYINEESGEIEEEELGAFIQYPLRLAWAITIHKSQGLTFEKTIIDAKQAFAAGQSYVALSRCTSLEGIVLRSQITPSSIQTHTDAIEFSSKDKPTEVLQGILENSKKNFWRDRLVNCFDWNPLLRLLRDFQRFTEDHLSDEIQSAHEMVELLYVIALKQQDVARKFQEQLKRIIATEKDEEKCLPILKERTTKAVVYFYEDCVKNILEPIRVLRKTFKGQKKAKKYWRNLNALETDIINFLSNLKRVRYNDVSLFDAHVVLPNLNDTEEMPEEKKRKAKVEKSEETGKGKVVKGETQRISLAMFKSGKSIPEIAKERGLKMSTIEGHLVRFVANKELEVTEVVAPAKMEKITKVVNSFSGQEASPLQAAKEALGEEYSYGEIRFVLAHIEAL